ncbi:hypothetical protein [Leptospira weilii]|nr:hypothetical protein [Leptospira weilii]MCL8268669.1 hypothetical protein [Leptospira weilii]
MKITNKKDLKQLEKRRLKGIRLLERGYSCYRIAKELGVRKQKETDSMNDNRNEFDTLISEETRRASAKFIERIQNGTLKKRTASNDSSLDFSEKKALERFNLIVQDRAFEDAFFKTYGKL